MSKDTYLTYIDQFHSFLIQSGLMDTDEVPHYKPLPGGVSSDIWHVELPNRQLCIKRALPKLKVKEDWQAPISRNATEVDWLETANKIIPECAPRVLAHDPDLGMFAMQFISPETGKLWKEKLKNGSAKPAFASTVGYTLAAIHATSMNMPDLAQRFATDQVFRAIRLKPYLETTARRHPDLMPELTELTETTASTKLALVHGDISPQNILVCGNQPVFIDAEYAWWGDPAFDLAFCLNHFLLKCIWIPSLATKLILCFNAMTKAYLSNIPAHYAASIETRAARLLPALFLARIDGKFPVEYITREVDKDKVRQAARSMLKAPVEELAPVAHRWADEIGAVL